MEQLSLFSQLWQDYKIKKPIRLIELFAGYGSQHLALKYLGANFESHRIAEWAVKSIQAYKDLHCPEDHTDYSKPLTDEEVAKYLFEKGISADYNQPMTFEQIKRLGAERARVIYNNIVATKNLVSVTNIHAQDLEIKDKDKYEYILTYSFPCQDLSLAGKRQLMSKGSGTRSGLLWEVERILLELKDRDELPQVLLMENVTQVHGTGAWEDFEAWKKALKQMGYCNFWKDLIATDYGVPQTRDRTFMVSILGDYNYNFPKPIKLEKRLRDLLEEDVPEKYFLSDSMIQYITADNKKWTGNNEKAIINKSQASTINTAEGSRRCDASNYVCDSLEDDIDLKGKIKQVVNLYEKGEKKYNRRTGVVVDPKGSSTTLLARFQGDNNMVAVEDNRAPHNKALKETIQQNEIPDGVSMVDAYNRKIRKDGTAKTITTRVNESNNTYVALKRGYSVSVKEEQEDTEEIDVVGNYSKSNFTQTSIVGKNGVAPTVTENHGQVTAIPIKNATKKGYLLAEEGDGVDISTRMESHRGTVQKGKAQTLSTMGGANNGVVVRDERK